MKVVSHLLAAALGAQVASTLLGGAMHEVFDRAMYVAGAIDRSDFDQARISFQARQDYILLVALGAVLMFAVFWLVRRVRDNG